MSLKVKIWCTDNGTTEEDAREVTIGNIIMLESAVEAFASKDWADSDYWEQASFSVRVEDGPVRHFIVAAEQTVDFCSREVTK